MKQKYDNCQKYSSFNLSILECKFLPFSEYTKSAIVLIYPYWNVNCDHLLDCKVDVNVLIYPYWNVNNAERFESWVFDEGFNLSILECKSRKPPARMRPHHGFNLSILECKCCQDKHIFGKCNRFNLSILECKF